jgi:predicted MarR family transcription regulator
MSSSINLTELEKQVLEGINNSDYGSELGDAIWQGAERCDISGTKAISGVYSSLSKKGLIGTQQDGKDSTVWLTELGIEVCKEYKLLGKYAEDSE